MENGLRSATTMCNCFMLVCTVIHILATFIISADHLKYGSMTLYSLTFLPHLCQEVPLLGKV